jgi:hypothetical protein
LLFAADSRDRADKSDRAGSRGAVRASVRGGWGGGGDDLGGVRIPNRRALEGPLRSTGDRGGIVSARSRILLGDDVTPCPTSTAPRYLLREHGLFGLVTGDLSHTTPSSTSPSLACLASLASLVGRLSSVCMASVVPILPGLGPSWNTRVGGELFRISRISGAD